MQRSLGTAKILTKNKIKNKIEELTQTKIINKCCYILLIKFYHDF